jgi:hypothetical protein
VSKQTKPKNTGQFGQGNPGKPKGAKNKATQELKEMILAALDESGGVQYLVDKAESHPQAFMALIGRVLPMTVSGEDGGAIVVKVMKLTNA